MCHKERTRERKAVSSSLLLLLFVLYYILYCVLYLLFCIVLFGAEKWKLNLSEGRRIPQSRRGQRLTAFLGWRTRGLTRKQSLEGAIAHKRHLDECQGGLCPKGCHTGDHSGSARWWHGCDLQSGSPLHVGGCDQLLNHDQNLSFISMGFYRLRGAWDSAILLREEREPFKMTYISGRSNWGSGSRLDLT